MGLYSKQEGMRYTTIIDLTEWPALYRNHNVRLIYLHMCLQCGYHDEDRDIMNTSVRRLAADVGVSVSAVRHALHMLETAKLIERMGTTWVVKKWIPATPISQRTSQKLSKTDAEAVAERQRIERKREQEQAARERENAILEQKGKTNFMLWYEEQEKKAAAGDIDAKSTIEKNRKVYDMHKAMQQQNQTKKK